METFFNTLGRVVAASVVKCTLHMWILGSVLGTTKANTKPQTCLTHNRKKLGDTQSKLTAPCVAQGQHRVASWTRPSSPCDTQWPLEQHFSWPLGSQGGHGVKIAWLGGRWHESREPVVGRGTARRNQGGRRDAERQGVHYCFRVLQGSRCLPTLPASRLL